MRESSNDRPMRKKEVIRSREQEELLEQIDSLWKTNFSFVYLILCNTFYPLCTCHLNYLCLDRFITFTRCFKETLLDKTGKLGPLLLIPFCFGRNSWNFSYRYANWYWNTPRSTSGQISGRFGPFRSFWPRCKFQPVLDLACY